MRLAELRHTLRARVTWRGSSSSVSAATAQLGRKLPVNASPPTITDGGQGGGSIAGPIVGGVLAGSNGAWTGAVRYTYQSEDCGATGANCTAPSSSDH